MRNIFLKEDLQKIFTDLKSRTGRSWNSLANEARVSTRNLFDWRRGTVSIPTSFLDLIKNKFLVTIPSHKKIISESEMRSTSGRLGGARTKELYGNPGTSDGRRKGGMKSYQKQILDPKSPFLQKTFSPPEYNSDLAEFIGILLGDGGVTKRQVAIVVHKTDEVEYSVYIANLVNKIFSLSIAPRERKTAHIIEVVVSRTALVAFMASMGITAGNKVKEQVGIPEWIKSDLKFKKSCIRGLFDTDGCIYLDRHIINGKTYENLGMNFSNRSKPLLSFFKETLDELGFSPTQTTPHAIMLRNERDIVRYFSDIGSSNSKHTRRFETYLNRKRKGTEVVITAPTRNRMAG